MLCDLKREGMNTENNIFVSVVIPVYNAENTIEKCVTSVLKQIYRNLEIILIDDGSKDRSHEILDKFAELDARIKVVHQANAGVSAARNKGIDISTGKYICFVDSDDFIPANYVDTLLNTSKEGYFAWCGFELLTEELDPIERTSFERYPNISCRRDVMKLSCLGILNSPWCKLFDGDVTRKNGIRFPLGWQIVEDLAFNLDYLDVIGNQKIRITGSTTYHYVRQEGSLDNRYIPNYWEIHRDVLQKQKEYADSWGIPEEDWKLYYQRYWQYASHALYNTMLDANQDVLKNKLCKNDEILKEVEVQKGLKASKGKVRKREYFFYRHFGYTTYYKFRKLFKR